MPHHFERVGSQRTGCSNSHRFSSPAIPIFGWCSAARSFWGVSRFTVNSKAHLTRPVLATREATKIRPLAHELEGNTALHKYRVPGTGRRFIGRRASGRWP